MESANFTDHFLIAMPSMLDPNFAGTLTYVCDHGEQGAMGVVVNRPIELDMETLFSQIGLELTDEALKRSSVYYGGPVQTERGFVLHRPVGEWGSTLSVKDRVGLTTSKDILEAAARQEGPKEILVTLGYAGWGPGQLEDEIKQNAWLTVEADPEVIFNRPPEERLAAAMRLLGIDLSMLSEEAGHA
ncbi:MAG TPA: YqgE/AlgH family protein [Thiobacillaceae bacterium]|nr:YqgE/AlgH family protein [Thiobacillaceae bacterium]HNU64877.1 YqgE/AlgH family protein [Thiobacillaceae bacterium]